MVWCAWGAGRFCSVRCRCVRVKCHRVGISLWEILVEVPTVILGLYKSDIAAEETGACHMALL